MTDRSARFKQCKWMLLAVKFPSNTPTPHRISPHPTAGVPPHGSPRSRLVEMEKSNSGKDAGQNKKKKEKKQSDCVQMSEKGFICCRITISHSHFVFSCGCEPNRVVNYNAICNSVDWTSPSRYSYLVARYII